MMMVTRRIIALCGRIDPLSKDTGTASPSTAAGATAASEDLIALDIDVAEALASSTALIGRARRRSKKLKGTVTVRQILKG